MKHSYSKILGSVRLAVLDLIPTMGLDGMKEDGLVISRVNTPHDHRGRGHARELMRECLADADASGITLYLWINAYGDMSDEQLGAWYERCGFKNGNVLFVREPQVSAAQADKNSLRKGAVEKEREGNESSTSSLEKGDTHTCASSTECEVSCVRRKH